MKPLSWFAVCCLSVAWASAADFHVAPDGSDENPATVTAPVKSLEKARDLARAARKAKPDEPIQILVHPGIYMVRKTIEFTKDDSGTESAPLTVKVWKDVKSPNAWPKLVGADRTESIPNREFPAASEEQLKTNANQTAAQGWFWYHKQFPDVKSEVVTNDKGKRALRFAAANNAEMKYIKYACVRSEPFGFDPGKDYRLAFKLLTTDASGSTTARLVGEANGLWRALGSQSFKTHDGERTECQIAFHYPAEGEEGYDPRLGKLNIQFGFHSKTGTVEISDLVLKEVLPMSQWEAWQQAGGDVHSIIADPMFVVAKHGDFRLKPDSPALKQGVDPIPLDKIGPYEDDARATWPVQEAEGVREHPEWLQSIPIND